MLIIYLVKKKRYVKKWYHKNNEPKHLLLFSSVLERSQCLPIKCITCIWMFIQMCLWSCPSNLKCLKLVLDSNVSTMEMHLSSLRIWYRVRFTCTISCVFTAILGPQTWLISKYYILLQCILWFSLLPLSLKFSDQLYQDALASKTSY